MSSMSVKQRLASMGIWVFAFGYFAFYIPFSYLNKVLTGGLAEDLARISGTMLLPVSTMANVVLMFAFISAMGWWKYAGRKTFFGRSWPCPNRWTFLSGLCTAGIIATTVLAYTFEGVSIVLAMLMMRGGVLVIAPVVDKLSGRTVRWYSMAALVTTVLALTVGLAKADDYNLAAALLIDIFLYLSFYFVRFRFMTRLAKSEDQDANLRYFVEEQMTAAPSLFIILFVASFLPMGVFSADLKIGFTQFWGHEMFWWILAVGAFSQGTGIFGSLIFLDKRENTYCVPVNRSSSILAGVLATYGLFLFQGKDTPHWTQMVGAGLIIGAILFLSLPPALEKRRKRLEAQQAQAG